MIIIIIIIIIRRRRRRRRKRRRRRITIIIIIKCITETINRSSETKEQLIGMTRRHHDQIATKVAKEGDTNCPVPVLLRLRAWNRPGSLKLTFHPQRTTRNNRLKTAYPTSWTKELLLCDKTNKREWDVFLSPSLSSHQLLFPYMVTKIKPKSNEAAKIGP